MINICWGRHLIQIPWDLTKRPGPVLASHPGQHVPCAAVLLQGPCDCLAVSGTFSFMRPWTVWRSAGRLLRRMSSAGIRPEFISRGDWAGGGLRAARRVWLQPTETRCPSLTLWRDLHRLACHCDASAPPPSGRAVLSGRPGTGRARCPRGCGHVRDMDLFLVRESIKSLIAFTLWMGIKYSFRSLLTFFLCSLESSFSGSLSLRLTVTRYPALLSASTSVLPRHRSGTPHPLSQPGGSAAPRSDRA